MLNLKDTSNPHNASIDSVQHELVDEGSPEKFVRDVHKAAMLHHVKFESSNASNSKDEGQIIEESEEESSGNEDEKDECRKKLCKFNILKMCARLCQHVKAQYKVSEMVNQKIMQTNERFNDSNKSKTHREYVIIRYFVTGLIVTMLFNQIVNTAKFKNSEDLG